MDTEHKLIAGMTSFGFPYVEAERNDKPWIKAFMAPLGNEGKTLILLVDMQHQNEGASLTNSMERAVEFVGSNVVDPSKAEWVQLDSDGMFDQIDVTWDKNGLPDIGWTPLEVGNHLRTMEAFKEKYELPAVAIMDKLLNEIEFTPGPKKYLMR